MAEGTIIFLSVTTMLLFLGTQDSNATTISIDNSTYDIVNHAYTDNSEALISEASKGFRK